MEDGSMGADICRVCRCEATAEQPLFYPCLCSGSIKYVHQECLVEWLKHSRKKYCELCKHPFSFSPIYKEQMPQQLPWSVVMVGVLKQLARYLALAGRMLYLTLIWAFLVPYTTSYALKLYISWGMLAIGQSDVQQHHNYTLSSGNLALSILIDCLVGILVTIGMILLFLGLLLLRDYMISHRLLRIDRLRRTRQQREDRATVLSGDLDANITITADAHGEGSNVSGDTTNLHEAHHMGRGRGDHEGEGGNAATIIGSPNQAAWTSRHLGIVSRRRPETTLTTAEESDGEGAGVSVSMGAATDNAALSEASTRTNVTRTTDGARSSRWLQQVSPREYRAYLRRRELYRERIERHQNRLNEQMMRGRGDTETVNPITNNPTETPLEASGHDPQDTTSLLSFSLSNTNNNNDRPASSHEASTIGFEGGGGESSLGGHRRTQTRDSNTRAELALPLGASSSPSGVTFRDNIRCRICSSVTCINRHHVIQMSQRPSSNVSASEGGEGASLSAPSTPNIPSNTALPTPITVSANATPTLTTTTTTTTTNISANRTPAIPPVAEEMADGENGWFFLGMPVDVEANGNANMTFSEFIGITGSLFMVLQNAIAIVACNALVMHSIIFVPFLIGRAIYQGLWIGWVAYLYGALYSHLPRLLHLQSVQIASTIEGHIQAFLGEVLSGAYSWTVHKASWLLALLQSLFYNHLFWMLPTAWKGALIETMTDLGQATDMLHFSSSSVTGASIQLFLGYFFLTFLCACYKCLMIDRLKYLDNFHKHLLRCFVFFGAFLKLILMLFIELVIFPLICGWLIDLSLLPLVEATLLSRISFYSQHPAMSTLIHWALGTSLMLYMAMFVSKCRELFRPGLLYFIRNPNDPDNLPMKDMVDRPLMHQLLRAIKSAILYGIVVTWHVYGFALICRALIPNLAPLHFRFKDAMMDIPIDLLIHLFARFCIGALSPRCVGSLMPAYFKGLAGLLRISSYLYGGRYLSQENFPSGGHWVFVPDYDRLYRPEKVEEMYHRPVEPLDIAKIPTVEGKESIPIPTPEQLAASIPPQPRRIRRHARSRRQEDPKRGFTVVFRPRWLKLRFLLFCWGIWLFWQIAGILLLAVPVLLGRALFSTLISDLPVHDMYAFGVGFFLLISTIKALQTLYASDLYSYGRWIMRLPRLMIQSGVTFSVVGILWPASIGSYVFLLLSPLIASLHQTPVIFPLQAWAAGVPLMRLLFEYRDILVNVERRRLIESLTRLDGWTDMDFQSILFKLLLPYTLKLASMILGPPVAVLLICPLVDLSGAQVLLLQRWSYLLALLIPIVIVSLSLITSLRRRLLVQIRDEMYLVGRRLHNLERPPATAEK